MAPREKSQLKRARVCQASCRRSMTFINNAFCQGSPNYEDSDLAKKPRRSERLSQKPETGTEKLKTPIINNQLPSPLTHLAENNSNEPYKEPTAEPPEGRPSQVTHRTPE